MGDSPKLGLHLMEDEEEVIEHKPISQQLSRKESKRIMARTSWETSPLSGEPSLLLGLLGHVTVT